MKNMLWIGMALGFTAGAYVASNSRKAREMVTGAQDAVKSKLQEQKQSNVDINCDCADCDAQF